MERKERRGAVYLSNSPRARCRILDSYWLCLCTNLSEQRFLTSTIAQPNINFTTSGVLHLFWIFLIVSICPTYLTPHVTPRVEFLAEKHEYYYFVYIPREVSALKTFLRCLI